LNKKYGQVLWSNGFPPLLDAVKVILPYRISLNIEGKATCHLSQKISK
jgi:hypothetical protein